MAEESDIISNVASNAKTTLQLPNKTSSICFPAILDPALHGMLLHSRDLTIHHCRIVAIDMPHRVLGRCQTLAEGYMMAAKSTNDLEIL